MDSDFGHRLAPGANLERLRKEAKQLLRDLEARNPHARARFEKSGLEKESESPALSHALHCVAKENGFPSWPALVRHFETASKDETGERAKPEGIKLGRLAQVALDCTDLEQASAFYEGCLGLERIGQVPGVLAFFDAEGVSLYLQRTDEVRPNSCLYFAVEGRPGAIESAYQSLKQRGVRVGDPPHCIAKAWQGHDVWLAFFEDPFGNQLALRSDVPVGADEP